jgi:hypothetical protein
MGHVVGKNKKLLANLIENKKLVTALSVRKKGLCSWVLHESFMRS